MARRTRKKVTRRKITVTDTGKEIVATMPGPDGGFLTISAGADLELIRSLIKKRQELGKQIAKVIAAQRGFPITDLESIEDVTPYPPP
jgi:chorismate mutase